LTTTGSRRGAGVPALRFEGEALIALDQTALPWREVELELRCAAEVAEAIRRLQIRGAPLIGVAAAYGVAIDLVRDPTGLGRACEALVAARPTAVNLRYAVDRVRAAASPAQEPAQAALAEARAIEAEETAASDAIAAHGADLLRGASRVLTHCNTGSLAAPGRGTALAVLDELWRRGVLERATATESRPLLQGARLTVYELHKWAIPHQLVVDSAAAGLIAGGEFDAVVVGCDRVAANGDVANKVGTYGLALAANAAGIPFVVAGPVSTIDPACPSGRQIVIEERDEAEVRRAGGIELTLPGTACRNPAFDITPAELLTALVTERGTASPVNSQSIRELVQASGGTPGAR
jgi:methylthioribose-1-phosphate isomerase